MQGKNRHRLGRSIALSVMALAGLPVALAGGTKLAAAVDKAATKLQVSGGSSVVVTKAGGTHQLVISAKAGSTDVPVPGTLTYRSSNPSVIKVTAKGLVSAVVDPGSAVVTVSTSAPGVTPAEVTVAAVELRSGAVDLSPADVISLSGDRAKLRRDSATTAVKDGTIVVDASAGLVGRIEGVTRSATTLSGAVARVPLKTAFKELRISLEQQGQRESVRVDGRHATVRSRAGALLDSTSSVQFNCIQESGSQGELVLTPPSASLEVTGTLDATLTYGIFSGGLSVTLEAGASVSGEISLGSLQATASGTYDLSCELEGLPDLALPLPTGLPPLGQIAVTVSPMFTADLSANASGTATITGPAVSDTWSASAGITYDNGSWSTTFTKSTPAPTLAVPTLEAGAAMSASLDVAARLDLGIALTSDGDNLAGVRLGWAELDGDLSAGLSGPPSDLDYGYKGPTMTLTGTASAGVEVSAEDSELTTLLSWVGVAPPSFDRTLFSATFLDETQPVPTISSSQSSLDEGQSDQLSASVPALWKGLDVDFVAFPASAAPGEDDGVVVASGVAVVNGVASTTWTPVSVGTGATAPGTYVLVAELDGIPGLPFPSAASSDVTVTSGTAPSQQVCFDETGLAAGNWSVTLAASTQSASGSQICFTEPDGTYGFSVSAPNGYTATPSSGEVTVAGTAVTQNVTLSGPQTVCFDETGLDGSWSVTLGGSTSSSGGSQVCFTEPNGDYAYSVSAPSGYDVSPATGSVNVDAAPVVVEVTFTEPSHQVCFDEVGLPGGSRWSIDVGGSSSSSAGSTDCVSVVSGSYGFSVSSSSGFTASPSSGTVTVGSSPVTLGVDFTAAVCFEESGLPGGTQWSGILGGQSESSTSTQLCFAEPAGSYAYTLNDADSYDPSPSSGTLSVAAPSSIAVTYSPTTFQWCFDESGLPNGSDWTVSVDGDTHIGGGTQICGSGSNASYSFTVGGPQYYAPTPASGSFTISGANASISVSFSFNPPPPVFTSGPTWSATIPGGATGSITGTVQAQANGAGISILNCTWGDNPGVSTRYGSSGSLSFTIPHTYTAPGVYTITCTATDTNDRSTTVTTTAIVVL